MAILAPDQVTDIRCQPKTHPCPGCGKRGRRVRRLTRRVRSLAYKRVAWVHVHYAEYRARCRCRHSFRSWPLHVPAKADYDASVRQAVLDRLLLDGLNVERTRRAMRRDFLVELSSGFVYACLDWQLTRLNQGPQRRQAAREFSGTLCLDELHLGRHTLLLATDPVADRIVGFLLVPANDQAHMLRLLRTLAYWGFQPRVVVTDGSNLYPATLAEVWPKAKHQLCVFHVLQDVTGKVLDAVRRLRRQLARRGNGGRKRRKGRPSKAARRRREARGLTSRQKAAFVFKHRFLVVKRWERLSKREGRDLLRMLDYAPELRTLRAFCLEVYQLFEPDQLAAVARRRRAALQRKGEYHGVPELEAAVGLLPREKFDKMVVFLEQPAGQRVRTNNHVERVNRQLRFQEKVRYKWRTARSLYRFLCLRVSVLASAWLSKPAHSPPQPELGIPPAEVGNSTGD